MEKIFSGFCIFIIISNAQSQINNNISKNNIKDIIKDPWKGLPMRCTLEDPKNVSISCHGVRIVKKVIQELLERAVNNPDIELTDGVHLVDNTNSDIKTSRSLKSSIIYFLENRELRVKLTSLIPSFMKIESFNHLSYEARRTGGGFGGLGGKKGGGSILILGAMMGKMLGIIGFGALGMMTMKALMASSMALMLSMILAAKKFSGGSSGSSDGGHHIVYAQQSDHHERKRSINLDLPYNGWINTNLKRI